MRKIEEISREYLVKRGDVLGIEQRLREIDENYQLFFNTKLKRFEVHNGKNRGNTLAVVCPFSSLDKRLVDFVRRTRVERGREIFREIEDRNAEIESKNLENAEFERKSRLSEIVGYLKKKG